jgi:hypothetical protein
MHEKKQQCPADSSSPHDHGISIDMPLTFASDMPLTFASDMPLLFEALQSH